VLRILLSFTTSLVKGEMSSQHPDCNPLDYYIWSVFERDVNRSPHNTAASLKAKITDVMANLPRDTMAKACRRFRQRIEAVVEAGGDFLKIIR
jgi:hypothetical protein